MSNSVAVRFITDVAGCRHFQYVEQQVWQCADLDVAPHHILITVAHHGGLLLGAYAADGPALSGGMVGGLLGWPGLSQQPDGSWRIKHCSHQVGVLPRWQRMGVALALKLAQRAAVLEQGMTDWVTWTYDPLRRANGVFNLHRLGGSSCTYIRDFYGPLTDGLNAGAPTDRCEVDWRLQSPRAQAAAAGIESAIDWQTAGLQRLLPPPHTPALLFTAPVLAVPVPDDVDALRVAAPQELLPWREYMRAVLEHAFAAGYVMQDCILLPAHGWHYILQRAA